MSKAKEVQVIKNLIDRRGVSVDLGNVITLANLRLARYKDDLVNNESEQIRGRAKELRDLIKILMFTPLDNPDTLG